VWLLLFAILAFRSGQGLGALAAASLSCSRLSFAFAFVEGFASYLSVSVAAGLVALKLISRRQKKS
jgi:hypothetical protein